MRKDHPNLRAMRMLAGFNKRYFPLYFLQILTVCVSPFFNLWMSAEIVTALYDRIPEKKIWMLVGITLAGDMLLAVLGAVLYRIMKHETAILENNEKLAFLNKTLSLDYDKLEDPSIRTLRRTIRENTYINANGIQRLRWSVESLIDSAINLGLSMIFFSDMLMHIFSGTPQLVSILYLVGIIACLAGIIVYSQYAQNKQASFIKGINDAMLDENRVCRAMPGHNRDIRLYRQNIYGQKTAHLYAAASRNAFFRLHNYSAVLNIPTNMMFYALRALIYLLTCMYCIADVIPVGSVIKYIGYMETFTENISQVFFSFQNIRANTPFIETYLSFFDIQNTMYQGSLSTEKRSDRQYQVEFHNVSFRYPGSTEYVIRNLSLKFNIGSRLAVVGKNGSGKTTFIKLLCRLYDPTEGEILLNGIDIRKYDYRDYLSIFSVVFQDFRLFSFPLAQNVAAAEIYDSARVADCLTEAGFGERLASMPDGIGTPLYKNFDENGVEISGGEAQKIALARALYKDSPFIILDEPTAALDPIAEAEIYSKFNDIVGDRTAIYISHRLSSCRFCDEIAVFDNGLVVQMGNHDSLVEADGLYQELWHAQAQYYTEQ